MARAALFDMDRTLVRKETVSLWARYQRDIGEATLVDRLKVLFWVLEYTAGVVNAMAVAEKLALPLKGMPEQLIIDRCNVWFPDYVLRHVSPHAVHTLLDHKRQGHFVAIVTGATRYVTDPLARRLGVDHLVTSELDVDESGLFTGRLRLPLCYGEGKLARARELAARVGFALEEATFYSDSFTDLPLLEAVGEPVVVNPDLRLRRHAGRRGWRIERW
jgi:HAD superfamily hydrolase (TIGR01490 family)